MANICKRCLINETAEKDQEMLEKYMNALKLEDQVSQECFEARISTCKSCNYLHLATCNACGCYVELRAVAKNGNCPHNKWES